MKDIWLIVYGCICRYRVIEHSENYLRVRMAESRFELVGSLNGRAFDVYETRIAGHRNSEIMSLKVFDSFSDAFTYLNYEEKGIIRMVAKNVKAMKTNLQRRYDQLVAEGRTQQENVEWRLWPDDMTKTYIMVSGYGRYKIGKTRDLLARERDLKCSDPTIRLYAACPRDIENELHREYEPNHFDREWYRFSEAEIDNLIDEHGFVRIG